MQPSLQPSVRLNQAHMFVLTMQNKRRNPTAAAVPPNPLPHPQLPYILLPFSFTDHVLGPSELMLPLDLSQTPFLLFIFSPSLLGRRFRHKGRLITTLLHSIVPLPPSPNPHHLLNNRPAKILRPLNFSFLISLGLSTVFLEKWSNAFPEFHA